MSAFSFKVHTYEVRYRSGTKSRRISLVNSEQEAFAQLIFLPDDTRLPNDAIYEGIKRLYYRISDFANCLDILRNEDRVNLYWEGPGAESDNSLGTSYEPVGDGERVP